MELLINNSIDPAFNLALEEHFLVERPRELVVLWRNDASVIIGKNQNAQAEVNLEFTQDHDIAVIRRQSGGGAVFHDLGNINFTLINKLGKDDFSNYRKFTAPICDFLQGKGLDVCLDGRNDLVLQGYKFSGNAQAVKGNWILSHGTLLYSADFSRLVSALKPSKAKIESKGVSSIRSRVTNLQEHLPEKIPVEKFFNELTEFFANQCGNQYQLDDEDTREIHDLIARKYGTWEWNIGESPEYAYSRAMRFPFGTVEIHMDVREGNIRDIRIFGDYFGSADTSELEQRLIGKKHQKNELAQVLGSFDIEHYIHGMKVEDFLTLV